MKCVFLSDLHIPTPVPLLDIKTRKQVTGYLNWHIRRKRQHTLATLELTLKTVLQENPDWVLIGGDIINLGTYREIKAAKAFLDERLTPQKYLLTLGNHDCYTKESASAMREVFKENLFFEDTEAPSIWSLSPHTEALILNSGIPTKPFSAIGALSDKDFETLQGFLTQNPKKNKIILIHHPYQGAKPNKALLNGEKFKALCERCQSPLYVLSGHIHDARQTPPLYTVASASEKHPNRLLILEGEEHLTLRYVTP